MAHKDDYYRVLGVSHDASVPEIRRAYRRLAREHHPDRNPEPDGPERFRTVAEAYAVLGDPPRRAHYDHSIQPAAHRDPQGPRATSAVPARRGVLELSPREAALAATTQVTLTTTSGMTIVLPAGVTEGDQIIIPVPGGRAVLSVGVTAVRRT